MLERDNGADTALAILPDMAYDHEHISDLQKTNDQHNRTTPFSTFLGPNTRHKSKTNKR